MANATMKILVRLKASATLAAPIGATAPMMLPGRKKRAYPSPRLRLGVSLAMMAEFAAMPRVLQKL